MSKTITKEAILQEMNIAESFKRFRKEFKLSQQDVADALNIKQQSYAPYESKKAVIPNAATLFVLSKLYDVSVDYLLGLIDEPRPPKVTVKDQPSESIENDVDMVIREWQMFKAEIMEMANDGKPIDVRKAVHNAEYFAEIERRTENVKKSINVKTFSDEEWDKISNA